MQAFNIINVLILIIINFSITMEYESKRMTEHSSKKTESSMKNKKPSSLLTINRKNQTKIYHQALEDYRKLCLKTYSSPNPVFASILKSEIMTIYLSQFNLKEIHCINRIIGKYQYFKEMILAPYDPSSII